MPGAAVTMIPSQGAPSGAPSVPCPTRTSIGASGRTRVEPFPRLPLEARVALDRCHLAAHRGEDRRLVPGARPDLEDPVARAASSSLIRDDERPTDRLPRLDRERLSA